MFGDHDLPYKTAKVAQCWINGLSGSFTFNAPALQKLHWEDYDLAQYLDDNVDFSLYPHSGYAEYATLRGKALSPPAGATVNPTEWPSAKEKAVKAAKAKGLKLSKAAKAQEAKVSSCATSFDLS